MAINPDQFVKFVRGTPAAFERLSPKLRNTLYFITEDGATTGKLYLGEVLISNCLGQNDLESVIIENVGNKDLLVYDAEQEAWVNMPINDAISTFNGATATQAGSSGLVPAPSAGDNDKFLRGDGQWVEITTGSLETDENVFISNADSELTLVGFEEASDKAILQKVNGSLVWSTDFYTKDEVNSLVNNLSGGGLSRTIVDSLESIDLESPGAENYIYLVANDSAEANNNYDEYLVVVDGSDNKSLERVGSFEVNLENYVTNDDMLEAIDDAIATLDLSDTYVTISKYDSEIGNVASLLLRSADGANGDESVVDSINYLTELLTWNTIPENE